MPKPRAPKELKANILYRQKLIKLGNENQSAREDILLAAARDPVWFIDVFLFGFNPRDHADSPERPFITYGFQERLCRKICSAIGNHDLVIPKSRAVGGTYIILATLFHRWMFRPMQSFLLASAKEDRVDRKGDPSCLMFKLDHFLQCLPSWMRPPFDRTELRLENYATQSIFNGESTNSNVDRGGRRTCILADEAAAMEKASSIAASIQHVTNSCLWLSTFQGAFGAFFDLYTNYSRESPDWVVKLGWWDHPEYSQGMYRGVDGKLRSPWYDKQCLRALGPRWIAQELDMEPAAAGGQYYEPALLDRLLGDGGTVRKPVATGELAHNESGDEPRWQKGPQGRLLLWCPLSGDYPPRGDYVLGCDIASGKGGPLSSQSAVSIVDRTTGEKAAEFKTNNMTPTIFARYVVALARWFHGGKIIWGSQGPGGDFGVTVKHCRYGNIYRRPGGEGKSGFVETPESKLAMHGDYQDALHLGRFINRSEAALTECRQFIFANGTVEHSKAIQADQDPENKGKLHGDIVVADCMANQLLPVKLIVKPSDTDFLSMPAPFGSPAWKMQEYLHKKQQSVYY